jgi:hypothetical protein
MIVGLIPDGREMMVYTHEPMLLRGVEQSQMMLTDVLQDVRPSAAMQPEESVEGVAGEAHTDHELRDDRRLQVALGVEQAAARAATAVTVVKPATAAAVRGTGNTGGTRRRNTRARNMEGKDRRRRGNLDTAATGGQNGQSAEESTDATLKPHDLDRRLRPRSCRLPLMK